MAASAVSKLFSTEDFKIAKMLTDPPDGTATYDDLIDIPGIRSATLTPQIESKQLRGDNRELDNDSTLVAVEIGFEYAKISYPALAVMLGGTWNAGTGYVRTGADHFNNFRCEWRTPTGGTDDPDGDVHFNAFKCKITAHALGTAFEDYQILSATARGVFRLSDDKLWLIKPNETALAISA